MKLVDTNIWLALALSKHVFHKTADAWLATETVSRELLFCRFTQLSFLRLISTAAVVGPYGVLPASNREAWALYDRYLTDPRMAFAEEPVRAVDLWKSFTDRSTPSPKLWMDAYLAAFAVAGGLQLVTTDQAFQQFPGLQVVTLSRLP